MALYKNNSNIAQISLYGGGGTSPTYAQYPGEVSTGNDNKVDLSYGGNAGAGTGAGTVTPSVETPPTEVETPPTDTSGSEGGGAGTTTDTTIDSYYDYLKTEMPEHLKGIYNDTIAAIDQANAKTIAEINAAKERGIVDANTSYQHNLSTYGAKNEALRGMGLAGSGYSEYLDSQAYATQRAEVQGVKASALSAENEADANADAARLEAKTAYDKDILTYGNLAAEHLSGKYDSILLGAQQGLYSEEQVKDLAAYYGFTQPQIDVLTGAAEKYATDKTEAEASKAEENYWLALGDVRNGLYKEGDIDALCATLGITDATMIQTLKDEAKTYAENTYAANANNASTNITPDTTDDEIQDLVDQGYIDEPGKTELEGDRRTAQINEINGYLDIGDYDSAEALADKYYNNGNGTMDEATYQQVNFDIWCKALGQGGLSVADIRKGIADIDNAKNAGKLTATDAEALKRYMYASQGGVLKTSSYSVRNSFRIVQREGEHTRVYITLDGKEYAVTIDRDSWSIGNPSIEKQTADAETASILNSMAGTNSPAPNTLVMLGGTLYIYLKNDSVPKYNEWVKVTDTGGLYSKYNTLCGYQAKPTPPSHQSGGSTSSGGGSASTGASGGASTTNSIQYPSDDEIATKATSGTLTYHEVAKYNPGIRTLNEFNRGNNPDKQKYVTYQAYLKAMYEKYKN